MNIHIPAFGAILLLVACAAHETSENGAAIPAPPVHTVSAGESGIFANAFIVEAETGVVVIDSMLTVSDARTLVDAIEATGKPLLAVLVTHGHPDHYNGLGIVTAGHDVPIYALAEVDDVIQRDDAAKESQWKPVFGDEWPSPRKFPTLRLADGDVVSPGGLPFRVHASGPGESHFDSLWTLESSPPLYFVGDLVFHDVHSYLSDGHSREWLDSLTAFEAQADPGGTLFPGHGGPGSLALLQHQRAYLETYRATVRDLAAGQTTLGDAEEVTLTERMVAYLSTDKLAFLIALGADVVAQELALESPSGPE